MRIEEGLAARNNLQRSSGKPCKISYIRKKLSVFISDTLIPIIAFFLLFYFYDLRHQWFPYGVLDPGHQALLPPFLDDLHLVDQQTQVVVGVFMLPKLLRLSQVSLQQVVICQQKNVQALNLLFHSCLIIWFHILSL